MNGATRVAGRSPIPETWRKGATPGSGFADHTELGIDS